MQTMNISLPDPMKEFVEERVSAGAYSSASEYVRELVRADQKRHVKEQLEQILVNAMNSGDPFEITPEMLAAAPPPKPAASHPPATTHAPPPAAYPHSSQ